MVAVPPPWPPRRPLRVGSDSEWGGGGGGGSPAPGGLPVVAVSAHDRAAHGTPWVAAVAAASESALTRKGAGCPGPTTRRGSERPLAELRVRSESDPSKIRVRSESDLSLSVGGDEARATAGTAVTVSDGFQAPPSHRSRQCRVTQAVADSLRVTRSPKRPAGGRPAGGTPPRPARDSGRVPPSRPARGPPRRRLDDPSSASFSFAFLPFLPARLSSPGPSRVRSSSSSPLLRVVGPGLQASESTALRPSGSFRPSPSSSPGPPGPPLRPARRGRRPGPASPALRLSQWPHAVPASPVCCTFFKQASESSHPASHL